MKLEKGGVEAILLAVLLIGIAIGLIVAVVRYVSYGGGNVVQKSIGEISNLQPIIGER